MKTVYWRKPRPGPIGEDPLADEQANVPDDRENSETVEEADDHAEDDR